MKINSNFIKNGIPKYTKAFEGVSDEVAKEILKNENEKNKTGFLGKFFGSTDNTAVHIAGTIALILVVCGIIICISSIYLKKDCEQYWKFAAPLITSCLGYIFGKIK